MATNIVFGIVGGVSGPTTFRDILRVTSEETITASGASQVSTNAAQNPETRSSGIAAVTINTDVDVWIKIDRSPVAVANTSTMLLAGQMVDRYIEPGDRVAVLLK